MSDAARAKFVEGLKVRAFAEQMEVETGEHRPVAVRIVDVARRAVFPDNAQAIVERSAIHRRDHDLEQTFGVNSLQRLRSGGAVEGLQLHTPRARPEGANRQPRLHLVRAEHGERIQVCSTDDGLDVSRRHHGLSYSDDL
jgi:hypothetical protein